MHNNFEFTSHYIKKISFQYYIIVFLECTDNGEIELSVTNCDEVDNLQGAAQLGAPMRYLSLLRSTSLSCA